MIFVTVGSVAPFDELIEELDRLAEIGSSGVRDLVMQIGNGKYEPKNSRWFRFEKDLSKWYSQAELIITHNGAGTLFEILPLGKKIIVVPNPNTVQLENLDIVIKLAKEGHVFPCLKVKNIGIAVKRVESWSPTPYKMPPCRIHEIIKGYLLGSSKK
ncbi:MAG: PssE/Cps14G family polysaccharide biosynthesis glycosyltransferase [Candidatus Methanosuratincola sp.]|jgi:beta-1,4-N-acetylglucosaminyltransferase|nr:PssE/Cps14G family polysaccharide biosynthesis glycosyltransferase [Candidatus Methanosuratincola sp.]